MMDHLGKRPVTKDSDYYAYHDARHALRGVGYDLPGFKLLGYETYSEMERAWSENDRRICEALNGPYGKVFCRVLLIKRGYIK